MPVIVSFALPDLPRPVGGAKFQYEVANGLARRGHEVHVAHYPPRPDGSAPTSWFPFDPRVRRYYTATDFDEANPDFHGDFVFVEFLDERFGLPLVFVQHSGIYPRDEEERRLWSPCPKLCRAQWLADVATDLGVPADEVFVIRPGLDHEVYRVLRPVDDRPPVVSMLSHSLPIKGVADGLAALELVRDTVRDVEVVLFGTSERPPTTPPWARYVQNPSPSVLVREVYNRSRVFVCPSVAEGFGMPSIEAMACGAALVTTDNGGSRDFAVNGETALVCEPRDVVAMADHVTTLLRDDALRCRLAAAALELVAMYTWDATAEHVEEILIDYGRAPDKYRNRR